MMILILLITLIIIVIIIMELVSTSAVEMKIMVKSVIISKTSVW